MTMILSEPPAPRRNNVHPVFAGILASLTQTPATLQRAEYLTLLRTMDWQCEFTDDWRVRCAAMEKLARLRELQPTVDPDRELYRAARPVAQHGDVTL